MFFKCFLHPVTMISKNYPTSKLFILLKGEAHISYLLSF